MRARPVPTVLLVAGVLAALAAAPGQAADRPAAGTATSALSLLSATTGASASTVGTVELLTATEGGEPIAQVVVTPLLQDGAAVGRQTVGAGERRSVAGAGTAGTPAAGLVSITGPTLDVGAEVVDGVPLAGVAVQELGSATLLGLPVRLAGQAGTTSTVTGDLARTTQVLELRDLALPSVADLLAALGLDLSKLPVETLRALVTDLDLADPVFAQAAAALDAARSAAGTAGDAAQAAVEARRADLRTAEQAVAAAGAGLPALQAAAAERAAAVVAAQTALAAAQAAPVVVLGGDVPPAPAAEVTRAAAALATAQGAAEAGAAALAAGQAAVDAAQQVLAQARRLLDAALAAVGQLLDPAATVALREAALAVLDRTPLLSLDSLTLGTVATVTSAEPGGQVAEITGGRLEGLEVLGTDVVTALTGTRRLDLGAGVDGVLGRLAVATDELTGTLSHVLSTVPGLPALQVPAPVVQLLVRDTTTGVQDGVGTAATRVLGLRVTLPPVTLPVEVALPGAPTLPGLTTLPDGPVRVLALRSAAVGDVLTIPATTLGLGALSGDARFRAASGTSPVPTAAGPTVTSGVGVPTVAAPGAVPVAAPQTLPRTGGTTPSAVLALLLVAAGTWLHRRSRTV